MQSLQIFGPLRLGIGSKEGHDGREGGGGGEEEYRIVAVEEGVPSGRRDDLPGVADVSGMIGTSRFPRTYSAVCFALESGLVKQISNITLRRASPVFSARRIPSFARGTSAAP